GAERLRMVKTALPEVAFDPPIAAPPPLRRETGDPTRDEAVAEILRGWLEAIGPVTAADLARRLGVARADVEIGLARLENEGVVLRGRFTSATPPDEVEWCERRLLARIHRLTIGRLRREIEPVSAAEFIRFLLRWQHLYPGSLLHGRDGILQVIGQLQGLELPAPSWEAGVLPARIATYDPADLEALCLSGEVVWGRLSLKDGVEIGSESDSDDPESRPRRRQAPTRSAPLGLALREDLTNFLEESKGREVRLRGLSAAAQDVIGHLEAHGASFLKDVARATARLPAEVEEALWELVAHGLVTGDGIAGLRLLLTRGERRIRSRRPRPGRLRRPRRRPVPAGRWALLRSGGGATGEEAVEARARQLLRRYGVVFRELLTRESRAPVWRDLLRIYRSMEARGEIRGGRFVSGFVGEQFALPEAVEALRALRRQNKEDEAVLVSSADPLNLVGILTPGAKISPLSHQVILYRNGVPIEAGELGAVRHRFRAQDSVPTP
ncbi:MAG: DEAD/DEAH box helicase, partial [Anaerolineae bacterium]